MNPIRLLVSCLVLLGMAGLASAEPFRERRPLSAWLGLLREGDGRGRAEAAQVLARFGPETPGVAKALAAALEDDESGPHAAEALLTWKAAGAGPLAGGLNAKRIETRRRAAAALAVLGPLAHDAAAALETALGDTDPRVRFLAAATLAHVNPERIVKAIPQLSQVLVDSADPIDRELAAKALVRLGVKAKPAAAALRIMLRREVSHEANFAAALALRQAAPHDPETVTILNGLLERPGIVERLAGALELAEMGRPRARVVLALVDGLEFCGWTYRNQPQMSERQERIVAALARIGPEAVPPLIEALAGPEYRFRAGAARALAHFDPLPEEAVPALRKMLADEVEHVRRWAAVALVRHPDDRQAAVRVLVQALGDWGGTTGWGDVTKVMFDWHHEAARWLTAERVSEMVEALAEGSGAIGAGIAAHAGRLGVAAQPLKPDLERYLGLGGDPQGPWNFWAAVALVEMGEDAARVLPVLLDANHQLAVYRARRQRDPDISPDPAYEELFLRARKALLKIGLAQLPALVKDLDRCEDIWPIADVLADLARRHPEKVVPALVTATGSEEDRVRSGAAVTLGQIGPMAKAAAGRLKDLLRDEADEVRLRAAVALWQITARARDVLPVLTAGLKAESYRLRELALEALGALGQEAAPALPHLVALLQRNGDEAFSAFEALCRVAEDPLLVLVHALGDQMPENRMIQWVLLAWGTRTATVLGPRLPAVPPRTRLAMLEVLRMMGSRGKPAEAEVRNALHDEDPDVALEAAVTLGEIGGDSTEAIPVLRRNLISPYIRPRERAAEGLGRLGAQAAVAVPDLQRCLKDESTLVRTAAATALGGMGAAAKGSVPALAAALGDTEDKVRAQAVSALGRLGEEGIEPTQAAAALALALEDDSIRVRWQAAFHLGYVKAEPKLVVPALMKALGSDDGAVRSHAEGALKKLGPEAVPLMLAGLAHPGPSVRFRTTELLAHHGAKAGEAVPFLSGLLGDPDEQVRFGAADALAAIGPSARAAVSPLLKSLTDPDSRVRASAARALAALGVSGDEVLSGLSAARSDPDASVRQEAVRALGAFASQSTARQALALSLTDENLAVGKAAAEALAKVPVEGVPFLVEALRHEKVVVRRTAAAALIHAGPTAKAAKASLLAALQDPDEGVRCSAALALGCVSGDAKVVSALARVLRTESVPVRYSAALALGRLGPLPAEVQAVLKGTARDDRNEGVRCEAAHALEQVQPAGK